MEIDEKEEIEEVQYYIKEVAPYKLQEKYNFYEYKGFVYTNSYIKNAKNTYMDGELSLYFY